MESHKEQSGNQIATSDIRHRRLAQQPTVPAETTPRNTIEKDRLLKWDDLPARAKDNEYIHSGFRPSTNSYLDCFYIHNETGNI